MAKRRSLSHLLVHVSPLQPDPIRAVSLDCATVNWYPHSHFRCVVETAIWTLTMKPTTYQFFLLAFPFALTGRSCLGPHGEQDENHCSPVFQC